MKNIDDIIKSIACTIYKVAHCENSTLEALKEKSIFFMPELAFVYICGKTIIQNEIDIFGNKNTQWIREEYLGNGGPTDLVFRFPDKSQIAIEFKIAQTRQSYINDMIKLTRIKTSNTTKLFCSLIDAYEDENKFDARTFTTMELEENDNLIAREILCRKFKTNKAAGTSPINCIVKVLQVIDKIE